ncbi:MAG: S9 family peptidase [Acidobacteria bacterium]|nr:S9 family peptidase [Acidobacteriota bacterium]
MRPSCSRQLIVFTVAVVAFSAQTGAQDKRPMSFVDVLELPTIQDPRLSPDGKQIVFVMEKPDWKANRRVGNLYRVNADGTGQVQLTFGEQSASNPRWSPDGKAVAFLARRGSDEHNQIYLLHTDGGEARRLTNHPTAAEDPTWAPDGASIWFASNDAKTDEEKERDKQQDDVYAFEETNFEQQHLWTVDLEGKTKQITSGDFSVTQYELSDDGRRVAMMRAPSPLLEHMRLAEVWTMDAGGGNAVQVTKNQVGESGPMLSPDGASVLFTADTNEQFDPYYNDKIFLAPAAGGPARLLLADAPFQVENAQWSKDGRSVYLTANFGVHNELLRVDVATKQVTPLTKGSHNLGGWRFSDSAGLHVFTRNSAERPAEIYTLPAGGGGEPKRVTAVFDYVAAQFKIARQERLTWKGQDGQTVEGLLYYPTDYVAGRKYPLIVATHGGPAASDRFGFANEVQVYAGKGYAVLRPNYRGSTGYGDAFLRDMVKGYFKQAHLDVMTGADAVIAMGLADPDKMVKMGWSGGGHMTNKIVTFTDRFKAASSGAGAANWISMSAQSDHREFRTPWFGGTPWQKNAPIDLYWDHSPLKDVANVKTPTMFLVGQDDPRVPMPQSVEMHRALKYNGVPTKLWVAPREGHGWTELRHRLFKLQVEMEWFEKWLFDRPYTWEKAPGDEKKEPAKTTTAQ